MAEEDFALVNVLPRRLPEIRFDKVRLEDTLDFIRDLCGVKLGIHWKAMEGAGIGKDTPITLHARDEKLDRLLTLLLDQAAGGKPILGFVNIDGVLTISTWEDLARHTVTRIYDVRDLFPQRPIPAEKLAKLDELAHLVASGITGEIDKGSWIDNGGRIGSIRVSSGELIITQTKTNHELIVLHLARICWRNTASHTNGRGGPA